MEACTIRLRLFESVYLYYVVHLVSIDMVLYADFASEMKCGIPSWAVPCVSWRFSADYDSCPRSQAARPHLSHESQHTCSDMFFAPSRIQPSDKWQL